jgi:hypothetical protein
MLLDCCGFACRSAIVAAIAPTIAVRNEAGDAA